MKHFSYFLKTGICLLLLFGTNSCKKEVLTPADEVKPPLASANAANTTVLEKISLQQFKNELPATDLNAIRISYISKHIVVSKFQEYLKIPRTL